MIKAILVALADKNTEITNEHLDELAFLAETAGIQTLQRFVQRLPQPDVRTFVGKGKLAELPWSKLVRNCFAQRPNLAFDGCILS